MTTAEFAARIADDTVDAMFSAGLGGDWWGGPVVFASFGKVAVLVGVVDVDLDALDASRNPPPETLFHGWRELVDVFRQAVDDERRGRPSLRLLLPSSVIVGGVRPHDQPNQAFRSDWLVGARNVDQAVRLLWNHGRELLELASRAVVVGGDRFNLRSDVAGSRELRRVVRSCHRQDVCVGFGGVDLGVWALAGVQTVERLKHAGDRSSPLREVVELVERQFGGNHVGQV